MSQKKRKPRRPKLPKGEAKGKIVPVRFTAEGIKAVEAAAKASSRRSRSGFAARLMPQSERDMGKLGHYPHSCIPVFLYPAGMHVSPFLTITAAAMGSSVRTISRSYQRV